MTLKEIVLNKFYDYMSSPVDTFDGKKIEGTKTPVDCFYDETEKAIKYVESRIKFYEKVLKEKDVDTLYCQRNIDAYSKELEYFKNSNIKYQKKLFKETKSFNYTRQIAEISLVEGIRLKIAFYDDLGVPKGRYEEYKTLRTKENKRKFIKECTEVTHAILEVMSDNEKHIRTAVAILGEDCKKFFFSNEINNTEFIELNKLLEGGMNVLQL